MEELTLSPFDSHSFFHTVYGSRDHSHLYYGLSSKEPCVPFLFQSFHKTNPVYLAQEDLPETEELRRIQDMKNILHSFVTSNILRVQCNKYRCCLDSNCFSTYKDAVQHIRTNHKHDFEQLLRVLLYDYEQDHLSFFFTKLYYSNLLYPSPPSGTFRSPANQEYPSVLGPHFSSRNHKVEKISNNSIALLAQEKIKSLGNSRSSQNTKKSLLSNRMSKRMTCHRDKSNVIEQVYTMKDIYELDLSLFPTAERKQNSPVVNLLSAPIITPAPQTKPGTQSKNAKRKKKKGKQSETSTISSETKEKQQDEVKKTLEKVAAEEKKEMESLAKQKKIEEAKKAEEVRLKKEKELKEKQRKEQQRKEQEEKLRQQQEKEKQRKLEEKKRKLEKERQIAIQKEVERLYSIHGEAIVSEVIDEVVCELCEKLAKRAIQEVKKEKEKQRIEEEKRELELEKKRKKEEQFINTESSHLWKEFFDEFMYSESKHIVNEVIEEQHQFEIEQKKKQEMYYKQLEHERMMLHQQQANMYPIPPPHVYPNGMYNPNFHPNFHPNGPINTIPPYNIGYPPFRENPQQIHPNRIPNTQTNYDEGIEQDLDMDLPEHLQSELRSLMGEDFQPTKSSTTPPLENKTDFSNAFSIFGVPNSPVEPPNFSNVPSTNISSITSHTPEEYGFDPLLSVLIYNLPDVTFKDLCSLFDNSFTSAQYYQFLLKLIENEHCCFVQLGNELEYNKMLQLDGTLVCNVPIRIIPTSSTIADYSPTFDTYTLQGKRSTSPFDNGLGFSDFHVEPFVSSNSDFMSQHPNTFSDNAFSGFSVNNGNSGLSDAFSIGNNGFNPNLPFSLYPPADSHEKKNGTDMNMNFYQGNSSNSFLDPFHQ